MLKLGDKFDSFETFHSKLKEYERSVLCNYWIRDCRTLNNHTRKFPNSVAARASADLKYYYFRLACIKGGRDYVSQSRKRARLTFKQGCEARIFLKLSSNGKYLEIIEINEEHNHSVSEEQYKTLRHQRLNLPKKLKASCRELLRAHANKKALRENIIEKTGCLITLKDLRNLKYKKEYSDELAECVNILKDIYNCDVTAEDRSLFFQDLGMRETFAAYPEVIFVDGTSCLHRSKAAAYLIMVEDSEANGAVVAAGILLNENEATVDWFIEKFKESNPNSENVKVIMSNKDGNERSSWAFKKLFPNAFRQICLFHTLQMFNRNLCEENMDLSEEEWETSQRFFRSLAYATSEENFDQEYEKTKNSVPKIVLKYYRKKWHRIREEWVSYLAFDNQSLVSRTDNKLKDVKRRLETSRFPNLEDYVDNFFACVNQNPKNDTPSKEKACPDLPDSETNSYKQLLTKYAFEKVHHQIKLMEDCENLIVGNDGKCLALSSEGLFEVTAKTCGCSYWKSVELPCKHIFKFRSMFDMSLYEECLCSEKWTRKRVDEESNLTYQTRNKSKQKSLTTREKFKLMADECEKILTVCSELPTDVFHERMDILKGLVNEWSQCDDKDSQETSSDESEME